MSGSLAGPVPARTPVRSMITVTYLSPTPCVAPGVLVDAVAAGRPVVSTAFPHAVELLASGAGLVVPQRDPDALAEAIRAVITDAELADGMAAEARRLAPGLSWDAIALRYRRAAEELVTSRQVVPA